MEETSQFHPIRLDSLVTDSTLEFNLYIKTAGENYVLFRERSLEFGDRHRLKLLENQIETIYIRQFDRKKYGTYIEQI